MINKSCGCCTDKECNWVKLIMTQESSVNVVNSYAHHITLINVDISPVEDVES